MGPDWKTCSHCGLMVPPPGDGTGAVVAPTTCPGCGEALVAVAAESLEPLWFYAEDNKKKGPVAWAELAELLARGRIGPATLVRQTDETKWRRVGDVLEKRRTPAATFESPKSADDQPGHFFTRHERRPIELYLAFATVAAISVGYAAASSAGLPRPGGFLGHTLGIVGFALMLGAETLYSLRKRSTGFHKGRTSVWLQAHIFMGVVGPYLTLLHSAGRFQGLAGLVSLLTLLIVLSGFVGRYLYTAVPRSHDGAELAVRELEEELSRDARALHELGSNRMSPEILASVASRPPSGWLVVFGRLWLARRQRGRIRGALSSLRAADADVAGRIENLLMDRYRLLMMVQSLPATRRMMAIWHMVHVPMGAILFTLAFLHVIGAIYYSTLMR